VFIGKQAAADTLKETEGASNGICSKKISTKNLAIFHKMKKCMSFS